MAYLVESAMDWKATVLLASEISTAAAALEHCSALTLPNIRALLVILATLPVTTAEAERVFSKVERKATAARSCSYDRRPLRSISYAKCAQRQNTECRGGRGHFRLLPGTPSWLHTLKTQFTMYVSVMYAFELSFSNSLSVLLLQCIYTLSL